MHTLALQAVVYLLCAQCTELLANEKEATLKTVIKNTSSDTYFGYIVNMSKVCS